ncbi:MAG: DUF167 domain-containing protein [Nanoarchaeota archaeon]
MAIRVKVIPNAKKNLIFEENGLLKVYVKKPAIQNKANKEAIKFISEFLKVNKNKVKIIKGEKSRDKVVEVLK